MLPRAALDPSGPTKFSISFSTVQWVWYWTIWDRQNWRTQKPVAAAFASFCLLAASSTASTDSRWFSICWFLHFSSPLVGHEALEHHEKCMQDEWCLLRAWQRTLAAGLVAPNLSFLTIRGKFLWDTDNKKSTLLCAHSLRTAIGNEAPFLKEHLKEKKENRNKMKPTNPNADTYVEEQKQYLFETYLSHFPANPLVGHPALTHWVTLLQDTLAWHCCATPGKTLLLNTLMWHSCETLFLDTLVRHSCLTFL